MNLPAIERLLRQDLSLTYKLLRYLNSPLLGLRSEVKDIRRAMDLLGLKEFRRWISIMAVVAPAMGKPAEFARTAVQRGYFCEELAKDCGMRDVAAELFLMGLLSVADALLDRPMEKVLQELPLAADIETALRGGQNRFRGVYDIILAYEQGAWGEVSKAARRLDLKEVLLPGCYMKATERSAVVKWEQRRKLFRNTKARQVDSPHFPADSLPRFAFVCTRNSCDLFYSTDSDSIATM